MTKISPGNLKIASDHQSTENFLAPCRSFLCGKLNKWKVTFLRIISQLSLFFFCLIKFKCLMRTSLRNCLAFVTGHIMKMLTVRLWLK